MMRYKKMMLPGAYSVQSPYHQPRRSQELPGLPETDSVLVFVVILNDCITIIGRY